MNLEDLIDLLRTKRVPGNVQPVRKTNEHGVVKEIKPFSSSGKIKVGWVMHQIEQLGFRPFEISRPEVFQPSCGLESCSDDCENCRRLRHDVRGVPIIRTVRQGQLHDVTYWRSIPRRGRCTDCGQTDQVRRHIVTSRVARWRGGDNRVPSITDLGLWHPACFQQRYGASGSIRPLQGGGFETSRR